MAQLLERFHRAIARRGGPATFADLPGPLPRSVGARKPPSGARNYPTSLNPPPAPFSTDGRFQCSLGSMLSPDLCIAGLVADSSDAVVRLLAQRLLGAGHVRPSFEGATLAREKRSPTGLPFPGQGVAMPHAEPEHVLVPAIAVAALAKPTTFRQMGAPAIKIDVSLVMMPALTEKEQAAGELSRLVGLLQDDALRSALIQAPTSHDMYAILVGRWSP
jgi:galactitol PTS system EIIA component